MNNGSSTGGLGEDDVADITFHDRRHVGKDDLLVTAFKAFNHQEFASWPGY